MVHKRERPRIITVNPFTAPKSDQCQISPAASAPEILHYTVWRIWLFITYSDETRLYYNSHHLTYTFLFKRLGECTFELGIEIWSLMRFNLVSTPNLSLHLWVGLCCPVLKTLTLLQTKIYDFPYPISDLNLKMYTLFQTLWCVANRQLSIDLRRAGLHDAPNDVHVVFLRDQCLCTGIPPEWRDCCVICHGWLITVWLNWITAFP